MTFETNFSAKNCIDSCEFVIQSLSTFLHHAELTQLTCNCGCDGMKVSERSQEDGECQGPGI